MPGAPSYVTRVFDVTNSKILAPVVSSRVTSAVLSGLSLPNNSTEALQVFAFPNDIGTHFILRNAMFPNIVPCTSDGEGTR